jgi:hypothetical protein
MTGMIYCRCAPGGVSLYVALGLLVQIDGLGYSQVHRGLFGYIAEPCPEDAAEANGADRVIRPNQGR